MIATRFAQAREKTRREFAKILSENASALNRHEFGRDEWSSFIGLALLSGVTREKMARVACVQPELILAWQDGRELPPSDEQIRATVDAVLEEVFSLSS